MKQFALIGQPLSHSHSPLLHSLLADYRYDLHPLSPEELPAFMRDSAFSGFNVTIPYKQAVMPYLDELGEAARRVGCVNTVVRRADGTLYGDNTDLYGMAEIARRAGMEFQGQKTLVLGSGGTSHTACALVKQHGGEAVVISRNGPLTYGDVERHVDAAYLINTTPVGMYPHTGEAPIDLKRLPGLRGVLDVVYNPLRTRLLQQAQTLGIPAQGGLGMLVYQAVRACELFTGAPVAPERAQEAECALRKRVTNVALVGMPGCGKSTVGALVAKRLGMPFVDVDACIAQEAGMTIPEIFAREGEAGFRRREAAQIARLGREGGKVLATGGGAVKDMQNRENLRLNSVVIHLTRDLGLLPTEGRPLSQSVQTLEALWRERAPLYAACADVVIPNDGSPEQCVRAIEEAYHEAVHHQRP